MYLSFYKLRTRLMNHDKIIDDLFTIYNLYEPLIKNEKQF